MKMRTIGDMTILEIETLQALFTPEEWDFYFDLLWNQYKGRDVSDLLTS